MAELLTVYDDEQFFVDCPICNKKINGETNLKIHRTTLQHLKREEALAAKGCIPLPAPLPEWIDIIQYLKYLNLDEPIIGLSELVQKESYVSDDGKVMLRYRCKQCAVEMDMCTMATHLVGRKHRQKYMERNRQDLVTWNDSSQKASAIVMRAKAAMVEKQEGWGTPVPLIGKKVNNQTKNRGTGEGSRALASQKVSSGRSRSEQSGDFRGQPNLHDEAYRKSLPSLFDCHIGEPYRFKDPRQLSGLTEERYASSFSQNERQRQLFQDDYHSEQPYVRDLNMEPFPEDRPNAQRSFDYQDDNYSGRGSSRGLYADRDLREEFNQGGISKSRFAESGTALHLGDMLHRKNEGMQDEIFTSHQGRMTTNPQSVDRTRSDSFEMQGSKRRYFSTEESPGIKKRKSRFSDATPLEIAQAHLSQIKGMSLMNEQNRAASSRIHVPGMQVGSDLPRFTPKMESVLDVLSDIQIDNLEEANFLKDKLCNLLKEFQSSKVQRTQQERTSVTDYGHVAQTIMEKDLRHARRSDDKIFTEFGKYDRDLRFQDSRPFQDNSGYFPDDRRRNEKDTFQASKTYESKFQKSNRFDDFQQQRGFDDRSIEYGSARQFENDSSSFQKRGKIKDEPRDYQHVGRYDMDSRSMNQNMASEERKHFDDYGGQSSRGATGERYGKGNTEYQREIEWNANREDASDRFDHMAYYPEDGRRGYEEDVWEPRSREKEGGFAETQRYGHDYRSDTEVYDPFNPSSPPRDTGHSTLDKLASTLLELVARKTH